jgi:hypothetical protein
VPIDAKRPGETDELPGTVLGLIASAALPGTNPA